MKTLPENKFNRAAIALGSNIGDAEVIFDNACKLLENNAFHITSRAAVIKTSPVDCPPGPPDFANSALIGTFTGTPEELLELTQSIENALGRPSDHGFHTPRTLDLDIILFGDQQIDLPGLCIPHKLAQQRLFVLQPLSEIAPDWIFPDSGISVQDALKKLTGKL